MAQPREPSSSLLSNHSEKSLLVKILAELRVQTLLMAQDMRLNDDIAALRDDVMSQGNRTTSDV